jgi:hypothetical protein
VGRMDFQFEVGGSEPHQVRFLTSRTNSKVTLTVDGKIVKQDKFRVWIPPRRHYEVVVGDSEQHQIAIEVEFPRIWTKFKKPTCSAYVDGKVVATY